MVSKTLERLAKLEARVHPEPIVIIRDIVAVVPSNNFPYFSASICGLHKEPMNNIQIFRGEGESVDAFKVRIDEIRYG